MTERGKYIVAEGPDGSGKSTVARHIVDRLEDIGQEAYLTREPGGTPVAEAIRNILLTPEFAGLHPNTEIVLFTAARSELWHSTIKPRLENGIWVISDRNFTSSLAYQGVARGFGEENIIDATRMFVGEAYMNPDLTLVIQPDRYEVAMERVSARGDKDRLEQEAEAFHKTVFETYARLCRTAGRVAINGSMTLDEVKEASWERVQELLG